MKKSVKKLNKIYSYRIELFDWQFSYCASIAPLLNGISRSFFFLVIVDCPISTEFSIQNKSIHVYWSTFFFSIETAQQHNHRIHIDYVLPRAQQGTGTHLFIYALFLHFAWIWYLCEKFNTKWKHTSLFLHIAISAKKFKLYRGKNQNALRTFLRAKSSMNTNGICTDNRHAFEFQIVVW